jgi:hypothetical protein
MPRPTDITEAQLQTWRERLEEFKTTHASRIGPELLEEVFFAGEWLSDKLREAEFTENVVRQVLFANGQITLGRDPWHVASCSLEDAKNGQFYEPGEKLSDDLLSGRLNGRFGPGGEGRTLGDLFKALQVSSLGELLARYNVSTVEELKKVLNKTKTDMNEHLRILKN